MIAVSVVLLVLVCTLLLYVNKQRRRLALAHKELEKANKNLEQTNRELQQTNRNLEQAILADSCVSVLSMWIR